MGETTGIQYYEPPRLIARLVHGAKVRVRINPECDFCRREEKSPYPHRRSYAEDVNGRTGTVCMGCYEKPKVRRASPGGKYYWHTEDGPQGHRFHIHFDEPCPTFRLPGAPGAAWWTGDFAALELIPLDDLGALKQMLEVRP